MQHGETTLVSAGLLDFGDLDLGAPAVSFTLAVTNLGNRDLVLDDATLDAGDAFSISGFAADTVVAPAATTTFDLRFAPAANGLHAATLELVTNDAFHSPFALDLQGIGTTAPRRPPCDRPHPHRLHRQLESGGWGRRLPSRCGHQRRLRHPR